jgi:hypothetical protein
LWQGDFDLGSLLDQQQRKSKKHQNQDVDDEALSIESAFVPSSWYKVVPVDFDKGTTNKSSNSNNQKINLELLEEMTLRCHCLR